MASDGANDYSAEINRRAELAAMEGGGGYDQAAAQASMGAPPQYAGGGQRDAIAQAMMAQQAQQQAMMAQPQQTAPQGAGDGVWRGGMVAYNSPEYADWERQMVQQQQLMQAYRENPYLFQQGSGPGNSGIAGPGGAPSGGFSGGGYGPFGGGNTAVGPNGISANEANQAANAPNAAPAPSGWGAQQGVADYGGITGPTSAGITAGTAMANGPGMTMGGPSSGTSFSGGWGGFGLGAQGVPGLNATPGLGMNPGWGGLNGQALAAAIAANPGLMMSMDQATMNAMNMAPSYGYDSSGNGLGGSVGGGIGGSGGGGGGYGFGIGPGPGGENSVGPGGEAGPY